MRNQPTSDQPPAERLDGDAHVAPPDYGDARTAPPQSEWFALPGARAATPILPPNANWGAAPAVPAPPVYPPPPEYYSGLPTPAAPQWAQNPAGAGPAGPPIALPGSLPYETAPAYPAYAPDGRVDPAQLAEGGGVQAQKPSGKPEAAGCASGAAIIGILSNVALGVKFLLPALSVIVSFGVYAAIFGWQFGLGIIVLLFIHEMGHYVVIRAKGLPAGLPVFIPLLGAYVAMRKMPHNVRDEAEIGIAGPIAGGLAGLLCLGLYFQTALPVLVPLAYFSFLINLINLAPVAPLDGARVTAAISRWFWPVGLLLLAVGIYYTQNIFLILIGVIGLFQMIARFRESPAQRAYYAVSAWTRVYVTALYFGLIAALALALVFTQHLLPMSGLVY